MSVVVPDEILIATRMSETEMRQEIAVMLFQTHIPHFKLKHQRLHKRISQS
jgi:predicted HTH domain antitoxin